MGQKRERDEPRRHSRLPAETLSYYQEVSQHFQTLSDIEERQLLADNALGEASVEVAVDAACSRVLETLLPHASTPSLCDFTKTCVEGESLGAMCTSGPFGSHVLEKCLIELAKRATHAGDGDFEEIEGALAAVTEAAGASLYEMATSKYGSFVARRLLCVLAGRDVAPAPGKKAGAAEPPAGDQQQSQQQGARSGGNLAAKLRSGGGEGEDGGGGGGGGADYPALLDQLAAVVLGDDWSGEEMTRLATDSFAGPFLQALLRACTHNTKLQQRLLLHVLGGTPSKGVESVSMDRCHALMQDRNGSHLMEAVFSTAPDDYFAKLSTLCFKGHLLPLAQHSSANFAVQAAIAALRKPQQLKRMFEDLRPSFPQLLRSRRSGVLAALLAAAGRLGTQEAEAAAAMWAAAGEGFKAGSPVEALLTLDTTTQLGSGGRLSTLGCAMLMTLLRLPPTACKQWAEAVSALPRASLQHVAKDPGGCRVLEAFLEGPGAVTKKRRALLQGLAGAYGEVAAGGSGSHFVEKCYALAEVKEKEVIAGELAAAEARLMTTHRGPLLLKRCHVEAFKKGSDGWQQTEAADAARREFEDLFGEAEAAAEEAAGRQGNQEGAEDDEEEEESAEQQEQQQEEEQQPKKKNKKGKKAAAAEEEQQRHTAADGCGDEEKQRKKKKKVKKRLQEGDAAAESADAVPAAKPKKKGKKDKA